MTSEPLEQEQSAGVSNGTSEEPEIILEPVDAAATEAANDAEAEANTADAPDAQANANANAVADADAPSADAYAALERERDELRDSLLRSRAEFDNYRKRTAKDIERIRTTAAERLLRELLPVADNLERAVSHTDEANSGLLTGVRMVMKQFADVLTAHGVEPIESVGAPFDPAVHEALAQQASDEHPADTVAIEYERGYRLGESVLRHAKVVVSTGPAGSVAEASNQAEQPQP